MRLCPYCLGAGTTRATHESTFAQTCQACRGKPVALEDSERRILSMLVRHGCVWPASPRKSKWLEDALGLPFQLEKGPLRGGEGSSTYPMGRTDLCTARAQTLLSGRHWAESDTLEAHEEPHDPR
jgi:hypothetical protein